MVRSLRSRVRVRCTLAYFWAVGLWPAPETPRAHVHPESALGSPGLAAANASAGVLKFLGEVVFLPRVLSAAMFFPASRGDCHLG
ncbi:hypothetical protein C8Q77DRAFT_1094798 [Trametes polyzona]|nr:hypothetical protein C8Q77DRAFT_1094798 [Trametes polyzona]